MQQIKYVPIHGQEPVLSAGIELIPGEAVSVTDEQAEMLLRSRFVVDAKTGKNPNFVCTTCSKDIFEDGTFEAFRARTHGHPVRSLVGDDGKRRCASCVAPAPVKFQPAVRDDL